MHLRKFIAITGFIFVSALIACSVKPDPIDYGHDECNYCKMTIVDKAHSAQLVTKRGKQYKFDAIECMARIVYEKNELGDGGILLVADYNSPGQMLPAKEANYVISPGIKSPMGANLSAVSERSLAEELIRIHGGEIYSWEPLKKFLSE